MSFVRILCFFAMETAITKETVSIRKKLIRIRLQIRYLRNYLSYNKINMEKADIDSIYSIL